MDVKESTVLLLSSYFEKLGSRGKKSFFVFLETKIFAKYFFDNFPGKYIPSTTQNHGQTSEQLVNTIF